MATGVAIGVAAFLPWVSVTVPLAGTISRSGVELGDGWIMLMIGAVAAVAGYAYTTPTPPGRWALFVAGLAATAFSLIEIVGIQNRLSTLDETLGAGASNLGGVGIGLWLGLAAGVVAIVLGGRLAGIKDPTIPSTPLGRQSVGQRLLVAAVGLGILLAVLWAIGEITR